MRNKKILFTLVLIYISLFNPILYNNIAKASSNYIYVDDSGG